MATHFHPRASDAYLVSGVLLGRREYLTQTGNFGRKSGQGNRYTTSIYEISGPHRTLSSTKTKVRPEYCLQSLWCWSWVCNPLIRAHFTLAEVPLLINGYNRKAVSRNSEILAAEQLQHMDSGSDKTAKEISEVHFTPYVQQWNFEKILSTQPYINHLIAFPISIFPTNGLKPGSRRWGGRNFKLSTRLVPDPLSPPN
jgi:hypothetical protein